MTGSFLNALGILLGALLGLARRAPLTPQTQKSCQSAIGVFTALCGFYLLWLGVGGSFGHVLKQLFTAMLAVVLGNLLGKILGLQKLSNRLGRHAAKLLAAPEQKIPAKPWDGFTAATILFCAAPLGMVGAVTDGLGGYFYPLAIKAAMDGLAMAAFVKLFRWPAALAAAPVFLFLCALTGAVHAWLLPRLAMEMIQVTLATAGLIVCATTLVILEVRRVELANYLPAILLAPLLAKIFF